MDTVKLYEDTETRFEINDLDSLNWLLKKIALLERQKQDIIELRDKEIARIQAKAQAMIDTVQSQIDFFLDSYGPQAEQFVKRYTTGTKRRSVQTLWGRAGFRRSRETLQIHNTEAVINFAKQRNLPVKVIEKPLVKPLLEYAKETGEIPEGAEYVPSEDKFYLKAEWKE